MASSGEGLLNTCHTVEEWKEKLEQGKDSEKTRHGAHLAASLHRLFLKVDVDDLKTVAEEWDVEAMPTFIFIKAGKTVERIVGANKDELLSAIAKHTA